MIDIRICNHCALAIQTGDLSPLDYHYDPDSADRRAEAVSAGMDYLADRGQVTAQEGEPEDADRKWTCECCDYPQLEGSKIHLFNLAPH